MKKISLIIIFLAMLSTPSMIKAQDTDQKPYYLRVEQVTDSFNCKAINYIITLTPAPVKELKHPKKGEYKLCKPHLKGVWFGTYTHVIESYNGKRYPKDKPVEILGFNGKWNVFRCRYYGDICYFPSGILELTGYWKPLK